jgi:hypothetical protein
VQDATSIRQLIVVNHEIAFDIPCRVILDWMNVEWEYPKLNTTSDNSILAESFTTTPGNQRSSIVKSNWELIKVHIRSIPGIVEQWILRMTYCQKSRHLHFNSFPVVFLSILRMDTLLGGFKTLESSCCAWQCLSSVLSS